MSSATKCVASAALRCPHGQIHWRLAESGSEESWDSIIEVQGLLSRYHSASGMCNGDRGAMPGKNIEKGQASGM
jgi:hypothetical protein